MKSRCGPQRTNIVVACVMVLPHLVFLNFASHLIQSWIMFRVGLTRMTRTKCNQLSFNTEPSMYNIIHASIKVNMLINRLKIVLVGSYKTFFETVLLE